MTTFAFETIQSDPTAPMHLDPTDILLFANGSANGATVIYNPASGASAASITIIDGGHSATFDFGIAEASAHHDLAFSDGSHLLIGGAGSDVITGFARDAIFGGDGADLIDAHHAHVLVQGNQGDDTITAGQTGNTVFGGQGNDSISLGHGLGEGVPVPFVIPGSFAQGNKGDDTIVGGGDFDTILGGQGDDHIRGRGFLNGNLGDDVIVGQGESVVSGQDGSAMFGEGGNDTLVSLGANTTMMGGAGADRFVFQFSEHDHVVARLTQIEDWASEDKISVAGLKEGFTFQEITMPAADEFGAFGLALSAANDLMHHGADVVIASVGLDVIAFFNVDGGPDADLAVRLTGRGLADITHDNITTLATPF